MIQAVPLDVLSCRAILPLLDHAAGVHTKTDGPYFRILCLSNRYIVIVAHSGFLSPSIDSREIVSIPLTTASYFRMLFSMMLLLDKRPVTKLELPPLALEGNGGFDLDAVIGVWKIRALPQLKSFQSFPVVSGMVVSLCEEEEVGSPKTTREALFKATTTPSNKKHLL